MRKLEKEIYKNSESKQFVNAELKLQNTEFEDIREKIAINLTERTHPLISNVPP